MADLLADPTTIAACSGKTLALDIETTGLAFWRDEIIGVGVYCPAANVKGYFPTPAEYERREVRWAISGLTNDPQTCIIAHNLTFEALFLGLSPRRSRCRWLDTMLMAHLDDSRQRKGLEAVVARYLGIPETKRVYKEKGRNQPIHKWPLDLVAEYCVNDCVVEYQLAQKLLPILQAQGLSALLQKDTRYLGLLIEMTRRGMLLDRDFVAQAQEKIAQNVVLMERELMEKVGHSFNWRSPVQLSQAIYDDLGIEKPVNPFIDEDGEEGENALAKQFNETCTSKAILIEHAKHPLGPLVLDLRESDKFCKNYLEKWAVLADSYDAIHGGFNITGTRTYRLSSSKPNLQNLPGDVRSKEAGGRERTDEYNLRQAFIARPGHRFLSIDHKQQEYRLLAVLAQDPQMLQFVRDRKDIHREVAEMIWGLSDDTHRRWAKTMSFGLLYGMSAESLRQSLGKSPEEAFEIRNAYLTKFPRIQPFTQECAWECTLKKSIRYWSGRIWREDDSRFAYKATNAVVQGGGAELISIAALRMQDWLDARHAGHIVSIIHDEILIEVENHAFTAACAALPPIMEVEDIFGVPFLADAKAGPNFGQLQKLEGVAV